VGTFLLWGIVDYLLPPESGSVKTLVSSRAHSVCKIILRCAKEDKLLKDQRHELQRKLIDSTGSTGSLILASSCEAEGLHAKSSDIPMLPDGHGFILGERWGQIPMVPLARVESEL